MSKEHKGNAETGRQAKDGVGAEKAGVAGRQGIGMFISMPGVAVAVVDGETMKFLEVSEAFSEIYGYTPAEMTGGMGIGDLEPGGGVFARVRETGGARVPTRMHRRKDGSEVEVELWAEPCGSGSLCCAVKEVAAGAAGGGMPEPDSWEMFRLVYEHSHDAIGVSIEGIHVLANPAYLRLFGYERWDELAGAPIFWLIAPEEHKRVKRYVELRASGLDAPAMYTTVGIRKDGTRFDMEVRNSVYEHEGRKHTLVLIRDITDLKTTLEALRRSEEKYRTLAGNVTDLLFSLDADFRCTLWNHACEEATGIPESEALGRTLFELFPSAAGTEVECACREVVSSRLSRAMTVELEIGGRPLKLTFHVYPAGPGLTVLARDVTGRARMEEDLHKFRKIESVFTLAGGIAHDFNNTMAVVLSGVDYAAEMMEEDAADAKEALLLSRRAIMDAKRITSQLLGFARGGAPALKEENIAPILRGAARQAAGCARVKVICNLPDELWRAVIDPAQIGQAVNGLLANAEEAMPSGGTVSLDAANIRVLEGENTPMEPGAYIRVQIRDTGIGIPAAHLPKIFDPYFTTKHKGQGLGLASVFAIVKRHGGHISAESEHGRGTTITMYLPAVESGARDAAGEAKPLKLLLMDDHEKMRELMRKSLVCAGHDAVVSHDGHDAVTKYEEALREGRRFDAVVLDLTVPGGMGGREAVEKLLELDPDVRAVVASGHFNDPVMVSPDSFGFRGVVGKPFVFSELMDAIAGAIDDEISGG